MKKGVLLLSAIGLLALCGVVGFGQGADKPAEKADKTKNVDLIGALKKSPGCLGVEAAQTVSGKQVIFAWFKDKRAVLKWYYSDVHRQVQTDAFPDYETRKPLSEVPENSGPILAIASITYAKKPMLKQSTMPISQIAIELYQPVSGGVYLGGRFAPESVVVPNMLNGDSKK